MPEVAAAIAIAVELGLGLLLLVGFKARWAALGIALFTFVITFIFHNFWGVPPEAVMASNRLLKNMGRGRRSAAHRGLGPGRMEPGRPPQPLIACHCDQGNP